MPRYSIVIAVYNRPDEMEELLASLSEQTFRDFEVVVVEDGSQLASDAVCNRWSEKLDIVYHSKANGGPGPARNFGCEHAKGEYLIFLDSDCMAPAGWLEAVDKGRSILELDAWGGPDREHPSFSQTQKAISYAMTSVLTTGGIRGARVRTGGAFHPRSFNMGMSRKVYAVTRGFAPLRFGEDIDLSIRMIEAGFRVGLIPDAWVYHKRRTDFQKFFKQVHNSGIARIQLTLRHPGSIKLTHFFPAMITVYVGMAIVYTLSMASGLILAPIGVYAAAIALHATVINRSMSVGLLAVVASAVQLIGYGTGFLRALVWNVVFGREKAFAFEKTFYE